MMRYYKSIHVAHNYVDNGSQAHENLVEYLRLYMRTSDDWVIMRLNPMGIKMMLGTYT